MNTVRLINSPTLAHVERDFAHWRNHREQRSHTPPALRQQAVALLEHHCPSHICQALGIHSDALKRWGQVAQQSALANESTTTRSPSSDFVALPPEEPRPQNEALRFAIERPDGLRLTVTGHFSLAELITTFEYAGASR